MSIIVGIILFQLYSFYHILSYYAMPLLIEIHQFRLIDLFNCNNFVDREFIYRINSAIYYYTI